MIKYLKIYLYISIFAVGFLVFPKHVFAAACNATGDGTWGGTDTANFTSCTGAASGGSGTGNRPGSADDLTINDGINITLSVDATITSLVLGDVSTDTNTDLTHADSTIDLTINGTVTINGGAGAADVDFWAINAGTGTVSGLITLTPAAAQAGRTAEIRITTGTLNANGGITFSSNGAHVDNQLLVISSSGTVNFRGAFTSLATADIQPGTTSTFNYADTAAGQTVAFDGALSTYSDLTINNTNASGATLGADLTATNVTGNVTVGNDSGSALFKNGGFAITGTSGKTFLVNNVAEFQMSGTSTYPTGFTTFTYDSNSTVSYLQTGGTTITNETYGNLNLKPASATDLVLPAALNNIAGNLTIGDGTNAGATGASNNPSFAVAGTMTVATSATYTTGTGTLTLSASGTPLVVNGTFTATANGTVNYTGTTATTVAGTTYANLGVGTNANATATTFTLGGDTTVSAVLTVGNAGSSANDTLDGSSRTLTLSGTNGDPFFPTAFGLFTASTSTVSYTGNNGGGNTTIQDTTYYNLTFNNGSEIYVPEASPLAVNKDLTVTAGTLSLAANSLNVGSTGVTNSGNIAVAGTLTQTSSATTTVKSSASGAATIGGAGTLTFYNLTIAPTVASATITLGSAASQTITVSNNLGIGDGSNAVTVTANTNDPTLDVNGNVTINGSGIFTASNTAAFTIAGNWSNSGTFNHSLGTVTFDTAGTSVLTGATTFNNFADTTAGSILSFTASETFTINGLLTITGVSANKIHIHSTSPPTQWKINHQGTESVTYAHISDSGCDVASTTITLDSTSTNDGNNGTCWSFPPPGIPVRVKSNVRFKGNVKIPGP